MISNYELVIILSVLLEKKKQSHIRAERTTWASGATSHSLNEVPLSIYRTDVSLEGSTKHRSLLLAPSSAPCTLFSLLGLFRSSHFKCLCYRTFSNEKQQVHADLSLIICTATTCLLTPHTFQT